ncbi:MAG: hypothetical protein DRP87_18660 [Spirochaetes bacterium]|nr:MAG: hypothetical protein DRP87_18660 [Spirochaetota bacterium]
MSRPQTTAFIILYIKRNVYDFEKVRSQFFILFSTHACPACQEVGTLKKHAWYIKYYYNEQLQILRCICISCGVTHAIIPEFSLPGTSIGIEEAEEYIKLREQGQGRGRASKVFSGEKVMSVNHPTVLDKAFRVAVERAKAIFYGQVDYTLKGCAWIEALTGKKGRPILNLNQYCLEHRVNGVCFTRYSVLLFRENTSRNRIPHNTGAVGTFKVVVDSW